MRLIPLVSLAVVLAGCNMAPPKPPEPPATAMPAVTPEQAAAKALGLAGDAILTPETVQALIAQHGAAAVAHGLATIGPAETGGLWGQVETGVASGAEGWLALVPALTPGVDAGTAEGLKLAIQTALAANAPGVLKLIDATRPAGDVCTIGLIEPTPEQLKAAKNAAVKAVTAVTDPARKQAKTDCLAELEKVRLK
ncbi:MAG: hypothetical protein ACOYJ6_15005 [Caulobacterales bacterium]